MVLGDETVPSLGEQVQYLPEELHQVMVQAHPSIAQDRHIRLEKDRCGRAISTAAGVQAIAAVLGSDAAPALSRVTCLSLHSSWPWSEAPGDETAHTDLLQVLHNLNSLEAVRFSGGLCGTAAAEFTSSLSTLTALRSLHVTGDDEVLSSRQLTCLLRGLKCVPSLNELALQQFPVCNGQLMVHSAPAKITEQVAIFCSELASMGLAHLRLQGCVVGCSAIDFPLGQAGTRLWRLPCNTPQAPKARADRYHRRLWNEPCYDMLDCTYGPLSSCAAVQPHAQCCMHEQVQFWAVPHLCPSPDETT